ncbi:MAG TPA: transglutaminase-like cysteine peptidase [Alphaproteobacteria bacterium]|nr:transglutaminase-like cysteine peptidase [Alphaproteobacteria bacterium]
MTLGRRTGRFGDTGARLALALACMAGLWLAALPAMAQEQPAMQEDIFGASSRRADNLGTFPRWNDVMQRHRDRADPPLSICKGDVFRRCMSEEWKGFLDEIATENRANQIRRVNERMNRSRYTTDQANWGQSDYWESPNQFFRMNGDCEDYAIAKYLSLRALGFPDDDLRIVVLNDLNLRVGHAILVVNYQGTPYVLDNQIAQVVQASAIRHYQPIYALNEKNWWFFRPKLSS